MISPLKTVLNVGCGPQGRPHGFAGLAQGWTALRLDIDPAVEPDVVGTMTDMSAVATGSVDAVVSSHNIEHLYPHEVPLASPAAAASPCKCWSTHCKPAALPAPQASPAPKRLTCGPWAAKRR